MALLSRLWVVGMVGIVALGAAASEPTGSVPEAPSGAKSADGLLRSADPLGTMIAEAKSAYGKARDYACTYTRQERVDGVLGAEQVGELKVRVNPYSVSVRFARPQAIAGLTTTYVEGSRSGKVKFRPAGPEGVSRVLLLSADDPKVMAGTRHPVTEIGIGPMLERLGKMAAIEKTLGNPVEVYTSEYQFVGRKVTRYEIFTRRPHAHRYAHRCLVFVDKETKWPLRFEAYDAPKTGTTTSELIEAHSFTDLKINAGLGDSAFE